MHRVGIAYILEKREIEIDNKTIIYYEIIDAIIGLKVRYNNVGLVFESLSKQNLGNTLKFNDNSLSKHKVGGFKDLDELTSENNNTSDIQKFYNEYASHIGEYYHYNSINNSFSPITDEKILNNIKKNIKDYDGSVLNNNTDISKMYNKIKKTIISQDEQIMQILTSLFKNQTVINSNLDKDMIAKLKENIIVYGSTGTGKTEILKRIAKSYQIPIVIEDATSLSETGYVGRNITDMLEDLYLAADKDINKAQKGILVIDEFDKLAEKQGDSKDHVSRIGVQRSLLKLLDGSCFYFGDKKFDTSNLTVVALGAFTDIVKGDDYSNVKTTDFVNYGITRELMGRFSKLVAMNPLTKDDIKKILIESNFSPLFTYKQLFETMNIDFVYEDEFIDYIAEQAIKLNSGARSLKTVFDEVISSALFRIFAGEYTAIRLTPPTGETKAYVLTKK